MLNKQEILGIANLARLELSENDLKIFGKQLSNILDLFKQIDNISTNGVAETSQITGIDNVSFKDEVIEIADINPIGSAINLTDNVPQKEGSKIIVPAVLDK